MMQLAGRLPSGDLPQAIIAEPVDAAHDFRIVGLGRVDGKVDCVRRDAAGLAYRLYRLIEEELRGTRRLPLRQGGNALLMIGLHLDEALDSI